MVLWGKKTRKLVSQKTFLLEARSGGGLPTDNDDIVTLHLIKLFIWPEGKAHRAQAL